MAEHTDADAPLSLRELAQVLIKHYGHTEGLWEIAGELQFGLGRVGPTDDALPGAFVGGSKVGLGRGAKGAPQVVGGAKVNGEQPTGEKRPKQRTKRAAREKR